MNSFQGSIFWSILDSLSHRFSDFSNQYVSPTGRRTQKPSVSPLPVSATGSRGTLNWGGDWLCFRLHTTEVRHQILAICDFMPGT